MEKGFEIARVCGGLWWEWNLRQIRSGWLADKATAKTRDILKHKLYPWMCHFKSSKQRQQNSWLQKTDRLILFAQDQRASDKLAKYYSHKCLHSVSSLIWPRSSREGWGTRALVYLATQPARPFVWIASAQSLSLARENDTLSTDRTLPGGFNNQHLTVCWVR